MRLRDLLKDFALRREQRALDRSEWWNDVHRWLTFGGSFRRLRRMRLQEQWIQEEREPRSERFLGWLGS